MVRVSSSISRAGGGGSAPYWHVGTEKISRLSSPFRTWTVVVADGASSPVDAEDAEERREAHTSRAVVGGGDPRTPWWLVAGKEGTEASKPTTATLGPPEPLE